MNLQIEDRRPSSFSILDSESVTLIVTSIGIIIIRLSKIFSTGRAIWRVKNGRSISSRRSLMSISQILSITNDAFFFGLSVIIIKHLPGTILLHCGSILMEQQAQGSHISLMHLPKL